MDAADTHLILICWDDARTDAEREAAREGMARSRPSSWTTSAPSSPSSERAVPLIAEQVCSGSASVRDFGALPWAYECGMAAVNLTENYPDAGPGWDEIKRRVFTVMTALTALDPAVS